MGWGGPEWGPEGVQMGDQKGFKMGPVGGSEEVQWMGPDGRGPRLNHISLRKSVV